MKREIKKRTNEIPFHTVEQLQMLGRSAVQGYYSLEEMICILRSAAKEERKNLDID